MLTPAPRRCTAEPRIRYLRQENRGVDENLPTEKLVRIKGAPRVPPFELAVFTRRNTARSSAVGALVAHMREVLAERPRAGRGSRAFAATVRRRS